ncbi:MAG: endonuclease, partial [Methylobacterium sp.]
MTLKHFSTALKVLAVLLAVATFLPLIPTNLGFVRSLDFPRLQVAVALVACTVALITTSRDAVALTLSGAMLAALALQASHILPFTPLVATQAKAAETCDAGGRVSLVVLNVLQSNRNYAAALDVIERQSPDIVLLLETDAGWQSAMAPLRERYPNRVEQPQDNTYG